jgi:hypothetical protein
MATGGPDPRFVAILEGARKTILRHDAECKRLETFDLTADPLERAPAAVDQAAARRLCIPRSRWAQELSFTVEDNFMALELRGQFIGRRKSQRASEDARRLRSLGYLQ